MLDILVQPRRDAKAAKRFFRKVRPERGRGLDVGRACWGGAVQEMKDCRPFGVALRGEASNHHMLRER